MADVLSAYPTKASERDRWIVEQRPKRNQLDPLLPYAYLVEQECSHTGQVVDVATIFLTSRECPWRCVMCDLWRNTLTEPAPAGSIPQQIEHALHRLAPARQVKLYNSGSFFDQKAIPGEDYGAIAALVRNFERVIVESHPLLMGDSCLRFRDLLQDAQLEVAMGLETAHPEALSKLNKRMTLDQFAAAAAWLRQHGIALRSFILLQPPFLKPGEAIYWAERSLDFAFDCHSGLAAVIPTRGGNGAMETLTAAQEFSPPSLEMLEEAVDYGIGLKRGRVVADLWDLEKFASCQNCFEARKARLQQMNLQQTILTRILCGAHE